MNSGRVSVAARLDRLPISKFHWRLTALVGGGMFFDNFDIFIAGAVLGVFLKEGFSNVGLNAWFLSATFAGMFIGTIGAGLIADRYGRRLTFQFNLGIFGLFSLASAFAPSMDWVIGLRFLCGIGLGAEIAIGYSTLAEFIPPSRRGRWLALLSMISSLGLLVSTVLSWLIIPYFGWRIMFAIPGVGALVILWMRKAIPESPRWLESRGEFAAADAVVERIEAEVRKSSGNGLPVPTPVPVVVNESMWQGRFVRPLILGCILQVVIFAAFYGLVSWMPTFLLKQGLPINRSLGQTALMAMGGPCGALIALLIGDKLGRRVVIIFSSLLAAALAFLFATVTSQITATALGFSVYALLFLLIATIQAVYLPELFPTAVRVRYNSACVGVARVTSFFTPFVVVFLFDRWGLLGVVSTVAALLVGQAIAMVFLGRETSGRSLEEIDLRST
jgi:MFS transporter, putative metabolite:H+ symporter